MQKRPYVESCDQNKAPILAVLKRLFAEANSVLEIGSGTGQHAVHFAAAMPHLCWQTSDRRENHPGILAWLREAGLSNIHDPIDLDVRGHWPQQRYHGIFSANTVHIMNWPEVACCFEGVGSVLAVGGHFVLYGPFNYNGRYTSDSNRRFDAWLKQRDPLSGIRDFTDLNRLAETQGLVFEEDIEMPVNNRILVWRRVAD
jgi:cyclopropane fatty-acyl-phospholipid synthase-like methyltransferase